MEATRRLKAVYPECNILVLTVHNDKQYMFEMLKAGASGYVTKQGPAEELVAAIRAVAEGQVYLQPTLASWLLDEYRRLAKESAHSLPNREAESEETGLESLSKRELEVLELVSEGYTTPQIAEKLKISPKTVSRHRERIMNKLNLHSSAALVKFAIRSGLIDLD